MVRLVFTTPPSVEITQLTGIKWWVPDSSFFSLIKSSLTKWSITATYSAWVVVTSISALIPEASITNVSFNDH